MSFHYFFAARRLSATNRSIYGKSTGKNNYILKTKVKQTYYKEK